MLIRFSVENFMSYKNTQVFSMVAGKQTKHRDHVVDIKGRRVLKGSYFFGANASGKSNLVEAISFARNIVFDGAKKNSLANKHFRIDKNYVEKPGVFQFDIYINGHFYSYGFAISYKSAIIIEEWLYLCDSTEQKIFERVVEDNLTIINTDVKFSDETQKQTFNVFASNVPDDKLLLSEISERKLIENEDFAAYKDVRKWFKSLMIITPDSRYADKNRMLSDSESEYNLAKLLKEFDTGIESISLGEERMEDILDFLPEKIKKELMVEIEQDLNEDNSESEKPQEIVVNIVGRSLHFRKENNQIFASQLRMDHGNKGDLFELSDESDGTQRLFDLIPIFRAGKAQRIIIVDELDRSFHTKLIIRFIQRFYASTLGVESQLIATVHDSNIMDLDILRQDEIWFVERKADHSSEIYSLNKFKARFDKKVAKEYLLGRYGAIPCFAQEEPVDLEEL